MKDDGEGKTWRKFWTRRLFWCEGRGCPLVVAGKITWITAYLGKNVPLVLNFPSDVNLISILERLPEERPHPMTKLSNTSFIKINWRQGRFHYFTPFGPFPPLPSKVLLWPALRYPLLLLWSLYTRRRGTGNKIPSSPGSFHWPLLWL